MVWLRPLILAQYAWITRPSPDLLVSADQLLRLSGSGTFYNHITHPRNFSHTINIELEFMVPDLAPPLHITLQMDTD